MKRWTHRRQSAKPAPEAATAPIGTTTAFAAVNSFLQGLSQLQGVPLAYLVPYPQLLPPESIRFFAIDPNWMQALYLGATSLVPAGMVGNGVMIPALPGSLKPGSGIAQFGFLLNSSLLANWPTTSFTAIGANGPCTPVRLDLLSPTLLIALYDDVVTQLTISQPSEGLALGFTAIGTAEAPSFTQELRLFHGDATQIGTRTDIPPSQVALRSPIPAILDFATTFANFNATVSEYASLFDTDTLPPQAFPLQLVQDPTQLVVSIG